MENRSKTSTWRRSLVRSAREIYEDTVNAASKGRAELQRALVALNDSAPAFARARVNGSSLDLFLEALWAQSSVLPSFVEKARQLSLPTANFTERLADLRRSLLIMEDSVDAMTEAAPSISKYGISVHDSAARRGLAGEWVVPVQAWIFRRNEERHRTRLALCRKLLVEMFHGIKDIDEEGLRRYEERGRLIFRTLAFRGGERNVVLEARFDGQDSWSPLPPTGGDGRTQVDLRIPADLAQRAAKGGILQFEVRIPEKVGVSGASATALAVLNEPEGVMVISDIDDTVKITGVFLGENAVVRNTFLEEFQPVHGMAELYASWQRDFGAAFCFVSNSPPELQEPLRDFIVDSGFPRAPLFLRPLVGSKEERGAFKEAQIKRLLQHYPRRQVVLVGDSGERDPALYASLLRDHPEQVAKALIRQVSPNTPVAPGVFDGVPPGRFQVFDNPAEATLPDSLRVRRRIPRLPVFSRWAGL